MYTQEQVNAMISFLKLSKDNKKKKHKVQYESDFSSKNDTSLYLTKHNTNNKHKNSSDDNSNYFKLTTHTDSNIEK